MSSNLTSLIDRLRATPSAKRFERLRCILPALDLAERFTILDELGVYHHQDSISGAGSTLPETAALRHALPELLREYDVRSILDIPCGDFNWLRKVNLSGIDYLGVDIVPRIVSSNRETYASSQRRFALLDATRNSLPRAELVISRDLFIHLSNKDIHRVLDRFRMSGSSWFLMTHFTGIPINSDIDSGDFRPVNLCLNPFDLPDPIRIISENSKLSGGQSRGRAMALWSKEMLRLRGSS